MLTLFGFDVYDQIPHRRDLADFLDRHSPLHIPNALRIDLSEELFPRPFIIYEKLPGKPADGPFESQAVVRELGDHLGRLHAADFQFWGRYPVRLGFSLEDWPHQVASSLERLARRWFEDQPEVMAALPDYVALARRLPPPASACMILPDLRPE